MTNGHPISKLNSENQELKSNFATVLSADPEKSLLQGDLRLADEETMNNKMIAEISSTLVLSCPFEKILADCAETLRNLLNAESVGIWTFDHKENVFKLNVNIGITKPTARSRSPRSFPFSRISKELRPFDSMVDGHDRTESKSSSPSPPQTVGLAGFPLRTHDGLLGVLMISSFVPLSDSTKFSISCVANSLALAMDRNAIRMRLEESTESSLLMTAALESTANGVAITDTSGNIEWVNKAFAHLTGYEIEEAVGSNHRLLKSGKTPESTYRDLWKTILQGKVWNGELINRRKNGKLYHEEMTIAPVRDTGGSVAHYVAIKQDITLRKSLEAQLTHRTLHDPLTKLANRALFHDRLEHSLDRSKRRHMLTSVLFLDLDNFKTVNDTLGHSAGDMLLKKVAERLRSCIRSTDTAARFGGDEFAILVESKVGSDGHLRVAESIRESLHEPFLLDGKEAFIGSSIGIASTSNGEKSPDDLMRNADIAMYIAKNGGKDRCAVYHHEMHEAMLKKTSLETDMRKAIKREEFELHYQPIVRLDTCSIIGMEALLRWRHPELGLLYPSDFISIAEESKLIIPIGEWVLREACRQANDWCEVAGDGSKPWLSVNISGRQFQDATLYRFVEIALATSGLPPKNLVLEIAEDTLLRNTPSTIERLSRIRSSGIKIAIDSFGTGYSSLNYLQTFPIDILKIDRTFTSRILDGVHGSAVAKAILTISNSLGFRTVAEGVESSDQKHALMDIGCELGQGYLFSEPIRSTDISHFLLSASANSNKVVKTSSISQLR